MASKTAAKKLEALETKQVSGIVTGLAGLYVAAALSQLALQPDLKSSLVVVWMIASSLTLVLLRLVLLRLPMSAQWTRLLGIVITALIIYNTFFHLYLLFGSGDKVVNWVLLGLGLATFLLPTHRLVLVVSVTLCAWVGVATLASPTHSWLYFAFGLFTASGLKVFSVFQESNLHSALDSAANELKLRHRTERKLIFQASHDFLTGLPNRSLFLNRLDQSLDRCKSSNSYRFAVVFLDLDRFKVVNDSLGHLMGDELLVQVAVRLQESVRSADTVARLGGDEFAILVENVRSPAEAQQVALRIQDKLASPLRLHSRDVFASAGIGIALSSPSYASSDQLLRDADTALYSAKKRGPASFQVFNSEMHLEAQQTMQLEHDLRAAVARNEFLFHFQPIISITTGTVVSAEALLRWRHPAHGLLRPADFLPLAEETGLSVPIGYWGLREVCRQAKEWQEMLPENTPLQMGFNLSATQFSHPDLFPEVDAALVDTQLAAGLLKLEITETNIMSNLDSTRAVLSRLREKGVQIFLDDFGTGYSSLSYLHKLPFDGAKFDRSFISKTRLKENYQIVKAMTDLIHGLGMQVVAEGVETARQAAAVKRLACDFGQGYYYSYPLNSASFGALLESEQLCPNLSHQLKASAADAKLPAGFAS